MKPIVDYAMGDGFAEKTTKNVKHAASEALGKLTGKPASYYEDSYEKKSGGKYKTFGGQVAYNVGKAVTKYGQKVDKFQIDAAKKIGAKAKALMSKTYEYKKK